jgi:hypothetical protein
MTFADIFRNDVFYSYSYQSQNPRESYGALRRNSLWGLHILLKNHDLDCDRHTVNT